MCLTTAAMGFSPIGVLLSFVYYEVVRVIVIRKLGKREVDFKKQYIKGGVSMIPFVLCRLF